MPEVPKIVHERLRSGAVAAGAHPDANVLTAFTEQGLAATERETVLAHLAACEECRDVLAFSNRSLEAASAVSRPAVGAPSAIKTSTTPRGSWFAWHRLGWAGLAAGIAIAAGVVVMQPWKQKSVDEAQQKTVTAPAPSVAAPAVADVESDKAASAPSSGPATTAANKAPAIAVTRRDEAKALAKATPALKERADLQDTLRAPAATKDAPQSGAFNYSAGAPGRATETVEVTSEAPVVASVESRTADSLAQNQAAQNQGGQNQVVKNQLPQNQAAPVFRAKAARALDTPAAEPTGAAADAKAPEPNAGASTAGARVSTQLAKSSNDLRQMPLEGRSNLELPQPSQSPAHWSVHGNKVQRSLDSGAHWKAVFRADRPLLCVTAGTSDVWAGGTNGDLFHSSNLGVTWSQVHPSIDGQTLADDITHIDIYATKQVVLFTSKNEAWSSTDGGDTWAKQ